mgnify:CR=1 FL=1
MSGRVLKFGGTSVGTPERIRHVAQLIGKIKEHVDDVVVVVSAMGETTDQLLDLARTISPLGSDALMAMLLSTGEQVSSALLAMALESIGLESVAMTGWQAGIMAQGPQQRSTIKAIYPERIQLALASSRIVVVTGFQGINQEGEIVTLGRGGSDTSAVALAAALGYSCDIYTDVDAICTIDPRLAEHPKPLHHLTYEETLEMASLGASVIDPRSIELASQYNVPVWVGSSLHPSLGTFIHSESVEERSSITNVSVLGQVAYIRVVHRCRDQQMIAKLFSGLAKCGINVDIISQNDDSSISFTITRQEIARVKHLLQELDCQDYSIDDTVQKVSVIGDAMRHQSGIASQVFEVLVEQDIEFYQISTSEISISYLIHEQYTSRFIQALQSAFNL